jgi:hypothetical protein
VVILQPLGKVEPKHQPLEKVEPKQLLKSGKVKNGKKLYN